MHDLIIIGGGPAGLTAALYAARYKLDVTVLAKDYGLISKSPLVENYPGIEAIDGTALITKFREQVKKLGVPLKTAEISSIKKTGKKFRITTKEGEHLETKTVLLATGAHPKRLNIGEDKYTGKGVSYCATCDAPFFKGKTVAVIGGSDTAATSALHLSEFAKRVIIIYRKEKLRAQPILTERIKQKKNIEVLTEANVAELKGENMLTGAKLDNGKELELEGLFMEIGYKPSNELAEKLGAKLDKAGYVKVNQEQKTNIKGLYAAGDLTNASNNLKQAITAASEGAVAANAIFKFLNHGNS